MADQPRHSVAKSVYALIAGAGLGGLASLALAPGYFWACLIGGAMAFGAIRVGYILATADDDDNA